MTKEIMPFEHAVFGQVRVVVDETKGEPWFVAKDVAEALGYTNARKAVTDHCKHSQFLSRNESLHLNLGRNNYGVTIIPESDVYRLIIRSKLPSAERFERWVMEEVLPTIRKHGLYATPQTVDAMLADPDTMIRALTALKAERVAKEQAQAALAEAAPKARIVDAAFATRSQQAMKLYEVARKLDGLNTMATKRDLMQRVGRCFTCPVCGESHGGCAL